MSGPLVVQSDMSILLEVEHADFDTVRVRLASFSELEKSPEYVHTYRITPLSVWNAASSGHPLEEIVEFLKRYSRYGLPESVLFQIRDLYSRFGRLILVREDEALVLRSDDAELFGELTANRRIAPLLLAPASGTGRFVDPAFRGLLKKELIDLGYPVRDEAGFVPGAPLVVTLRETMLRGIPLVLRDYQQDALAAFHEDGAPGGGGGVLVLPCGAGKTVVGLAAMAWYGCRTLILTTNIVALRQWRDELLDKTELTADMIGEYSGDSKVVRPVTLATYNIVTYRRSKSAPFTHFSLFRDHPWGLIIYDEVHLLPAPVFRVTAELQATRRLGLTATLVREDGLERDVFSLIGPKKFDMPWKVLENASWIARALCTEIRVEMERDLRLRYLAAGDRDKFRLASENAAKAAVVESLLARHAGEQVLLIGQFLDQLQVLAERFALPTITGATPVPERERLYAEFRKGVVRCLAVSKVANFSIDLPDAAVAIQVSGTFGSRQEEAQRLGRILRPKEGENQAFFYSIVTRGTSEQQFAANRQRFLTEQGYAYRLENWSG